MSSSSTPRIMSPETMHDFQPPFLRLEPGDVIDIRCANAACHEFLRVTLLPNWWLHIPAYHSRHCKRVARKHLEAQEVFTGCPHPLKATFRTEHEAREAAQTMTKGQALPVRPYRCTCGALHIGHAQFKIVSRLIPEGAQA